MKSRGFLKTRTLSSGEIKKEDKKEPTPETSITWPQDMVTKMLEVIEYSIDKKMCLTLEKTLRSGTAYEAMNGIGCGNTCCTEELNDKQIFQPFLAIHKFKKSKDDTVGETMDESLGKEGLLLLIEPVLSKCDVVLKRILAKAEESGHSVSEDEIHFIQQEIFRESLEKHLLIEIKKKLQQKTSSHLTNGGLLALPGGYHGNQKNLSRLSNTDIESLMRRGVAVLPNYIGEKGARQVYDEIHFLERHGFFGENFSQSSVGQRKEYFCLLPMDMLSRSTYRGLIYLSDLLQAIPFELNAKTAMSLLGVCSMFVNVTPATNGFYQRHLENGYMELDQTDNGRKIVALYFPGKESGERRCHCDVCKTGGIYFGKRRKNPWERKKGDTGDEYAHEEIHLTHLSDTLVLFRARDIPWEIRPYCSKILYASSSFNGVAGPGDQ